MQSFCTCTQPQSIEVNVLTYLTGVLIPHCSLPILIILLSTNFSQRLVVVNVLYLYTSYQHFIYLAISRNVYSIFINASDVCKYSQQSDFLLETVQLCLSSRNAINALLFLFTQVYQARATSRLPFYDHAGHNAPKRGSNFS